MIMMTPPTDTQDPFRSAEHWKRCAKEAQAIAESIADARVGQVLKQIIRQFERLARQADRVRSLF
jgi:hypothetical protein